MSKEQLYAGELVPTTGTRCETEPYNALPAGTPRLSSSTNNATAVEDAPPCAAVPSPLRSTTILEDTKRWYREEGDDVREAVAETDAVIEPVNEAVAEDDSVAVAVSDAAAPTLSVEEGVEVGVCVCEGEPVLV